MKHLFLTLPAFFSLLQVQQCTAFYLSYVAFMSSLALSKLTGYSLPSLYSINYDYYLPNPIEKRVTTGGFTPLGYDYDFCHGSNYSQLPLLNLLEVLVFGDRSSPYELTLAKNETCAHLCTKTYFGGISKDKKKLNDLKRGIRLDSKRYFIIDNIPIIFCPSTNTQECSAGFPMGCYSQHYSEFCLPFFELESDEIFILFNHLNLTITFEGNTMLGHEGRLVSVKVTPLSLNHSEYSDCASEQPVVIPSGDIPDGESFNITYTYSVTVIRNDNMKWASRWSYILESMSVSSLHWPALINSITIVLFMVLIPIIILKLVYKNAIFYKEIDCGEDVEQYYRWKLLIPGFIPPAIRLWLSLLLGSSIQLMFMIIVAIVFTIRACQKKDGRDTEMLWAMFIFISSGIVGGYATSRLYKTFKGEQWSTNIIFTSIICPGIAVFVFFVLDVILFFEDSSATIPLYTLGGFIGTLFLCYLPFTCAGTLFGFLKMKHLKIALKRFLHKAYKG